MMKTYNYTQDILTQTYLIGDLLDGSFRGVINDMPPMKYHGAKSYFSSSDLKFVTKSSPYHFKKMCDQNIGRIKQTSAMEFGSLVHSLLLTPEEFDREFLILPTLDRRTKVGREAYQLACDSAGDRTVTDRETYEMARECVDVVKKNPLVMELFGPCRMEVSYFWKCPFSGLKLRARADACTADYLVEVKTSASAAPSAFERQAFNMHYDLSAYHYVEGMRNSGGDRPLKVYFIVVENVAPYAMQVYEADEAFMQSGHDKWLDACTKLDLGVSQDKWPMYSANEVLPLSAPRWAQPKSDATDGTIENEEW